MKGDGLPEFICEPCLQLLNTAYQFRILCEQSDQALRNSDEVKSEFIIESHPLFNDDHNDSSNNTFDGSNSNENVISKNCVKEMFLDEEYIDQTE